jgi:hypothetical protein
MGKNRVVQNFITKDELTKVVNDNKPTSFTATMGVLIWAIITPILILPFIVFTFIMIMLFYPFWFLENKLRGENNV